MIARRLIVAGWLGALGGAAPCHETWMVPAAFQVQVGEEVRLDVTSGMEFPRPRA